LPDPLIYRVQELAAIESPVRPLVGNRRSAQGYVDRITRSNWWAQNCPGFSSYDDPPPKRVWVWYVDDDTVGGMVEETETVLNGVEMPTMILGSGVVTHDEVPAVADRWVILHELAHVMTNLNPGHHGPEFCMAYIHLVGRWLGPGPAEALLHWCKELKVRINYRLTEQKLMP